MSKKARVPAERSLSPLDEAEQRDWLVLHIPHRVRAAIAHSDLRASILDVQTSIYPPQETDEQKINWRCAGNSIWEGRLVATRWLIEFVGIKQGSNGEAIEKEVGNDVRIDRLGGGVPFDPKSDGAKLLADVWRGCSRASAHPTWKTNHPSVDEKELIKALKLVLQHLQDTIYNQAGLTLRNCVLIP